ncbi:uroporphyrinogen-III C-methyltransferase [Collimonas sp. OK412]|jgi:uroporphyrin-3 C-methyltransferase/uroporphyrinogen III methyltransferase/synthase|uniref:uroporphyrinogen-III C-methyltransferase n=1 Tax=Collimonas sp. (strain OK412) TaxID=1801619 RepID=UPI0008E2A856|nr:uroporphyrinogen-III C-methyltransferase [Collimonas sp. OK412]SFC84399.1 uroporphyrin-3 C-methyltransferase [Collimonas sp. OK412]
MNESIPTPESNQPAGPAVSATASPPSQPVLQPYKVSQDKGPKRSLGLVYGILLLLALLLAAQWWTMRNENGKLRQELARRLQVGDSTNTETKVLVKSVQDEAKELQGKVSVLENKQVESQSQQLALEQLYKDLSRNSDDWTLAQVEDVLSTASQQLQLAGNVQGALIALQNADKNLSRSDKPQFIIVRRAIASDIEKLKALPTLDVTGIAVRLDSIIGQIDSMPLLSDEKPIVGVSKPNNQPEASVKPKAAGSGNIAKTQVPADAVVTDWKNSLKDKWQSWSSEMWTEISQLIRVRTVDTPDALLLSPTQAYYARENLKLRLLNARLGLLSRNESAFRSDLIAAQETITKYFDTRAKQTQTVQTLLKQVQSSNLSITMPALDSPAAIRTYKGKP